MCCIYPLTWNLGTTLRGRGNGGRSKNMHFVILNNQLKGQNQTTINNIIRKINVIKRGWHLSLQLENLMSGSLKCPQLSWVTFLIQVGMYQERNLLELTREHNKLDPQNYGVDAMVQTQAISALTNGPFLFSQKEIGHILSKDLTFFILGSPFLIAILLNYVLFQEWMWQWWITIIKLC